MAVALSRFTTCLLRVLLFCFYVQTTIPVHIGVMTNILKTSQFKLFVDGEDVARTETFFWSGGCLGRCREQTFADQIRSRTKDKYGGCRGRPADLASSSSRRH